MAFLNNKRTIRRIGLIVVPAAIAVVAGVFYYSSARSCGADVPSEEPMERTFELTVKDGKVADDMRTIRAWQDDTVRLRWTTAVPMVVHLHGYDIEKKITPGRMTEIDFKAYATGRFPVTVHREGGAGGAGHEEAPLVMIEVYPR